MQKKKRKNTVHNTRNVLPKAKDSSEGGVLLASRERAL